MAFHVGFRFIADVTAIDGRPLGQLPLTPDFEWAVQAAHFDGVRRGELPPLMRCTTATIAPSWHPDRGAPHVDGVHITCTGADGARASSKIPRIYLRDSVETAALRLVEDGALGAGERFFYEVCAYPVAEPAGEPGRSGDDVFSVSEIPQPLPLLSGNLDSRLATACRQGESSWSDGDIPVFIPMPVLAEAKGFARRSPDVEWGGILIGRLCRDTATPEVFCEISALIPAKHTVAERTRLTFTAETWAAARDALDLRAQGELVLGFVHNHPYFCRGCPEIRRQECPFRRPFFSQDDVALMRTMFGAPFSVALLLSDLGEDELRCDLFGWRDGIVVARSYHLFGADATLASDRAGAAEAGAVTAALADRVAAADSPRRDGSDGCITRSAPNRASDVPQAP